MSIKNAVGSRALLRVLFAVLFAFSGLVSCGGGGGSTTVNTTAPTYTITATAGPGGTVTPSGATPVTEGSSQSYTITPNPGYIIATLVVDTVPVATSTTYTFTNVLGPHSISATFSALPSFTITATAGANGTVTPSGATTVFQGASQSYAITPNPGYIVATLVVDGNPIATSTTYTFINVVGPHSISATFSPAPAGNIVLSLVPARTSGVAPLAVFFDASATTDVGVTTRPFHDLEYTWDFGDPGSGTWANGAQPGVSSKNSATGPVAAHVFETPGTYTVAVTAFDGTNSATTTTTITVSDPNTIFSGTNTICISANSDPVPGSGGCPAGAAHHQQASFPTIVSSYACTGCRVLLKRGDTFTASSEARLLNTGPGILGAFGPGTDPKPLINMTGNQNTLGYNVSNNTDYTWGDWRVMDLSFNGGDTGLSTGTGLSVGSGGFVGILLLRDDFEAFETSIGFGADGPNYVNNQSARSHVMDQLSVVECTTTNGANSLYSGYNAGNRVTFMGNYFENGGLLNGTHVLRFTFLNRAVISNNHILHPGGTRHAIKMHAPYWIGGVPSQTAGNWSNYSASINGDGYTKFVIISDNHIESGNNDAWQVAISPQDAVMDERIHDVIFERNVSKGNAHTNAAITVAAQEVTIRNNLMYGATRNEQAFAVLRLDGGELPASNIRIYNNTMWSDHAVPSNQFYMVDINSASLSNITIKNNLAYAPNATSPVFYLDAGAANVVLLANSSDSQIKNTSPLFAASPTVVADFVPQAGSYAINAGTPVPVWSDFLRNGRPNGTMDIGAFEGL